MTPVESIEFMKDRMLRTDTNEEFLITISLTDLFSYIWKVL